MCVPFCVRWWLSEAIVASYIPALRLVNGLVRLIIQCGNNVLVQVCKVENFDGYFIRGVARKCTAIEFWTGSHAH